MYNLMTRHVDREFRKAFAEAMGYSFDGKEEEEEVPEPPPYSFPHEGCDCGIYGSVNLDEVSYHMVAREPNNMLVTLYDRNPIGERVLCIIEPSEYAEVILARKGWRAGAAFVSEIVGETLTVRPRPCCRSPGIERLTSGGCMKIGKEIKRVKSPARRTRKHDHQKWKVIPGMWPVRKTGVIAPVIITGS
jgi:hypothetical protein